MKNKRKRRTNQRGPKATTLHEPTPAEKQRQAEWDRLTKFPEYFAKLRELRKAKPSRDELDGQAVVALHHLMDTEQWFANNTPYPFKVIHWSQVASVADLACRYLRAVARAGNQDAIKTLAQHTVEMAETLTALVHKPESKLLGELKDKFGPRCSAYYCAKSNLEIFREVARKLPYWPVLYSRIPASNSHLPGLIRQLEVGKESAIRVSEKANYNLQKPINARMRHCIEHFEKVHASLRRMLERTPYPGLPFKRSVWCKRGFHKPIAKSFKQAFARLGNVRPDEIRIYRDSIKLLPLTHDTAPQWADVAIVPFVKARFPNWIQPGKSGRPRQGDFRKLVIQQLRILCPSVG